MLDFYTSAYCQRVSKTLKRDSKCLTNTRWVFFALLAVESGLLLIQHSLLYRAMFLTNWTLWLTMAFMLVQNTGRDNCNAPSLNSVKWSALLYEVTMTLNIFVVVLYWPLIYRKDM